MRVKEIFDTIWWEYRYIKQAASKYNLSEEETNKTFDMDGRYKESYNRALREEFKDEDLNRFISKDFPKEILYKDSLSVGNYYIFIISVPGPERLIIEVNIQDIKNVNDVKNIGSEKLSKPGSSYMYFEDIDGVKNFLFELELTFAGTYDININWN